VNTAGRGKSVTLKHKSPVPIALTQPVSQAARAGYLCQTPVICTHKVKEWNGRWSRKDRLGHRHLAAFERLRNHTHRVKAEIKQKSCPQQVEFTHVFVFVLVYRLKPALVTAREIPVVPCQQRR